MSEETIYQKVKCGSCSGVHEYSTTIKRQNTLIGRKEVKGVSTREYTRLFLCPKNNELYQGVIKLQEGDGDGEVVEVKVNGLSKE